MIKLMKGGKNNEFTNIFEINELWSRNYVLWKCEEFVNKFENFNEIKIILMK